LPLPALHRKRVSLRRGRYFHADFPKTESDPSGKQQPKRR
jgi:hypothetical protein